MKTKISNEKTKVVKDKKQKLANKLQKKYTKTYKVNEKTLKEKNIFLKIISVTSSVICCAVALFALVFCVCNFSATLQKIVPSFAGFSTMRISSGSMVKSGYKVGDTVVVKSVDAKTIKPNDVVAFYTYSKSYYGVNKTDMKEVSADSIAKHKSGLTFTKFFGFQNKQMKEAARSGSMLVFHHVRSVYQDEEGRRWFTTYGSSNSSDDTWLINEDYVVGISDNSKAGVFMSKILNFASTTIGRLALVIIPLAIISFVLIKQLLRDIQIARLQLSVIEEKRKLTDPICVKYEVGYSMDNKSKYKVLAQAELKDINLYLSLLWKNGAAPANIRKYYLRKKLLLKSTIELRDVNRNCEQMFKMGKDPKEIADYYQQSKMQIHKKYEQKRKRLKSIKDKYKLKVEKEAL